MALFFEMSVLVDWNCPASQDNNACYFEEHNDVLTKILVVVSKPKNGMFTWLRIHDPTVPVDGEKELLRWALYSPKEESDFRFVLFEEWSAVGSTSTTRGVHYKHEVKAIFEDTKKGLTEALILQTLRIRRLTAKAKSKAEIALRF
jgi:hypothetical protein